MCVYCVVYVRRQSPVTTNGRAGRSSNNAQPAATGFDAPRPLSEVYEFPGDIRKPRLTINTLTTAIRCTNAIIISLLLS